MYTLHLNNLQEHSHSEYSVNILMILFLHLWPTAKEEISSLFQIPHAKPVFPMQSISPWSPVSAKHNCMLSWALISKIEIISKTAGARGSLPCCHVLQQSSLTECFRAAAIGLWAASASYLGLQTAAFPGSSWHPRPQWDSALWKCLCWCVFSPRFSQEKPPAGSRGHKPRLRLWKALSCWQ